MLLPAIGYIQVHAFASYAQLPLEDVAISLTGTGGNTIALALTNEDGQFDTPIAVVVPDAEESQTPEGISKPYTSVNLYAYLARYNAVDVNNIQVFPGVTAVQDLRLVPQSEYPSQGDQTQVIDTPPQNL